MNQKLDFYLQRHWSQQCRTRSTRGGNPRWWWGSPGTAMHRSVPSRGCWAMSRCSPAVRRNRQQRERKRVETVSYDLISNWSVTFFGIQYWKSHEPVSTPRNSGVRYPIRLSSRGTKEERSPGRRPAKRGPCLTNPMIPNFSRTRNVYIIFANQGSRWAIHRIVEVYLIKRDRKQN